VDDPGSGQTKTIQILLKSVLRSKIGLLWMELNRKKMQAA
jgi:hypothetical protein